MEFSDMLQDIETKNPGDLTVHTSYTCILMFEAKESIISALNDYNDPPLTKGVIEYMTTYHKSSVFKRLDHALKRIKSKGYYAKTLKELVDISKSFDKAIRDTITMFYYATMAVCEGGDFTDAPIPEKVWHIAIECAMFTRHPKQFANPDVLFGSYIDSVIGDIFNYVFMLTHIYHLDGFNSKLFDDLDDLSQSIAKAEEASQNISTPDTSLLETLHKRTEILKEALSAEKRAHEKTIRTMEHDIARVQKEMTAEIESLKEQNAQLMEFILNLGQAEEDTSSTEPDLVTSEAEDIREFAHPLPTSRVLFLGGHRKLVKKLEALHPDWYFLSDNIPTRGIKNVDVIFFWTAHCSHKLSRKVFFDLPGTPPIIYVTATNMGLLEQEMLAGYNDLRDSER